MLGKQIITVVLGSIVPLFSISSVVKKQTYRNQWSICSYKDVLINEQYLSASPVKYIFYIIGTVLKLTYIFLYIIILYIP